MRIFNKKKMAGSYRHITDENNNFKGIELIGDLGDAYEALEECWYIINILSGGDKQKIADAHLEYIRRTGGNVEYIKSKDYWER
jgi:hypothetical protein